jgi:3-oxoacyl-(acyl-carrier-protein) synthase
MISLNFLNLTITCYCFHFAIKDLILREELNIFINLLNIFYILIFSFSLFIFLKHYKLSTIEFNVLIFFCLLGFNYFTYSINLISFYLLLEFQSLCFYILTSYYKNNRYSFEAGLKYFIISSFSSTLILFGLSIMYGFKGLSMAPATACTTGTHAIGLALRDITYGEADVVVAGGSEKASTPLGIAGFAAARALSKRNEDPQKASRPWDKDRDGFVLGDGAGAVVLEEYEHAKARGANIIAELAGFGMSSDAFHITRPSGTGAKDAMHLALKDAKLNANTIGYVNAHGTSTQAGDIEESHAIEQVLGSHASNCLVSSTKSMTGHLLGAAGAIEAIFTILALRYQIAPATINLDNIAEGANLDYVPNVARKAKIEAAISNSFGFGGTNGTLVFRRYNF